jgi:IMP dehydrogenase/GMP reductase
LRRNRRRKAGKELAFDNILLTEHGFRLINVGISALRTQVGDRIFARYLETEQIEMIQFRDYF